MTPCHRYPLIWLAFAIAFLICLMLAIKFQWPYGIFVVFAPLAVFRFVARNLACPQCDTPMGYGGKNFGMCWPRSFLDTHRNNCGCDLSK